MLTNPSKILYEAQRKKYAIGAFNIFNLESTKAVLNAALKLNSPVILQVSEGAIKFAGIDFMGAILETAASYEIPLVLHLDHGKSFSIIEAVIDAGFNSVMIDGSSFPFEENVRITREVVEFAHSRGIWVEGELGKIEGGKFLTDPDEAEEFVKLTGVDSLAVAIGTAHGPKKFKGKPKLDLERLKEIRKRVRIPLVLHGASKVDIKLVKEINKYGGKLMETKGVPDAIIKKVIELGISKINVATDLNLAALASLRSYFAKNPEEIKLYKIMEKVISDIEKVVEKKIKLFNPK